MLRIIARRLATGSALVLAVVTATFFLVHLAPGDPARLWVGPGAGAAELAAAREALNLDRPLLVQYGSWLADFVLGDWGISLAQQRPVTEVIAHALPYTILLSVASLLVTYLGGIALGTFQAMRHGTRWDSSVTVTTLILYGMPAYWLSLVLILIFTYSAARLGWPMWLRFPAIGAASLNADFLSPIGRAIDAVRHLTLPLTTLGLIGIAGTTRFVRGTVLDARMQPFVQAARARGLSSGTVRRRYVLRNAMIPIVTILGLTLPALFSGTVFIEVIFAWPGMGRAIVGAVAARDYPVVMATTAIFAVLVVAGNALADMMYRAIDPRFGGDRS